MTEPEKISPQSRAHDQEILDKISRYFFYVELHIYHFFGSVLTLAQTPVVKDTCRFFFCIKHLSVLFISWASKIHSFNWKSLICVCEREREREIKRERERYLSLRMQKPPN